MVVVVVVAVNENPAQTTQGGSREFIKYTLQTLTCLNFFLLQFQNLFSHYHLTQFVPVLFARLCNRISLVTQ